MNNKLIFILIFILFGIVLMQVPVNTLAGSRVKFTLFDLFAPVSGAFLGSVFGVIAVFLMQIVNLFVNGIASIDKGSIIRLFPTLFAVFYFSSVGKSKFSDKRLLLVPIISIIVFNLHPIGRTVWFYSLFWLIPIVMWRFRERFLLARSLGATFTAHSVGGAVWIWAFNLPASVWSSLIPVVILERSIFAMGISATYILMNNVLALISKNKILTGSFSFDKKYIVKILK